MKIYFIRCRSPSKIFDYTKHMFVFQEGGEIIMEQTASKECDVIFN